MKPNDAPATAWFARSNITRAAKWVAILGALLISPVGAPVLGAIELHLNPDASADSYFVLWWWYATLLIMILVGLVWWVAAIFVAVAFVLSIIYLLVLLVGTSLIDLRERTSPRSAGDQLVTIEPVAAGEEAPRPPEIRWFELIILATLAFGVIHSWVAWSELTAQQSPYVLLAEQSITLVLMGGLTLFVSRRRSNVAKWILIALFVLGLPAVFLTVTMGLVRDSVWIMLIQIVGQLVAYALLFTPASKRWLSGQAASA